MQQFLNLLYPPHCLLCQESSPVSEGCRELCPLCREKISWLEQCCPRCAMPLHEHVCKWCREKHFAFQQVYALALYQGEWRHLMHLLKYGRKTYLASYLGKMLAEKLTGRLPAGGVIIPVPLHLSKEKERGFNQSCLLARAMCENLSLPYREILVRIKDTSSQTGLNRRQREQNVRGAFAVKEEGLFPLKSPVVLVDDVMTTGATVNEASRMLKKAGAGDIMVMVAAR